LIKLLSRETIDPEPCIDRIIQVGFVKDLTILAGGSTKNADLQIQAIWCLTNIASGTTEQTKQVVPACPVLIQSLSGTNSRIKEHAVWALGNIAGDSEELRNTVIKMGAFLPLCRIMQQAAAAAAKKNNNTNPALVRTVAWTVSNMLKGRVLPKAQFYKHPFMESIAALYSCKDDAAILTEISWISTYLTSRDEQGTGRIIAAKFDNLVVSVLNKDTPTALAIPALRTIGNMLAYNDSFNSTVLSRNGKPILSALAACLKQEKHRGLAKESIWVIGNILAGPTNHVKAVLDGGFIPVLAKILNSGQFDLQREAVYALLNAMRESQKVKAFPKLIPALVKEGKIVNPVLRLLKIDDPDCIKACLNMLEVVLAQGKDYVSLVEEANGIECLEHVHLHPNRALWDHAHFLVDKYWGEDVDYGPEEKAAAAAAAADPMDYPVWRLGAQQQQQAQQPQQQLPFGLSNNGSNSSSNNHQPRFDFG